MPATTTGAPFSLNVPSVSSDLADLFGLYLKPNMAAINTNAAHKGTAQTFSALQTFSAGLAVSAGSAGAPSITPTGDANTGIFSPAADTLAISTGGAERLRVASSGNVGIGTTSPTWGIDVVAPSDLTARLRGAAGQHTVVQLDSQADNLAPYLQFARNGVFKWIIQAGTDNRLYVLDDDYNNGVYLAQDTSSWTANSDARLKDVTGPIIGALAAVEAMTGVRFTWKREAGKVDEDGNPVAPRSRVGLIAQDVLAALPEAVDDSTPDLVTDAETGRVTGGLGVRYTEVVPLLVNAIKELTYRVRALEAMFE